MKKQHLIAMSLVTLTLLPHKRKHPLTQCTYSKNEIEHVQRTLIEPLPLLIQAMIRANAHNKPEEATALYVQIMTIGITTMQYSSAAIRHHKKVLEKAQSSRPKKRKKR